MEFQRRFTKGMSLEELIEACADQQLDEEREFNLAINASHAAIAVPRISISAAHDQRNLVAASAAANWAALDWNDEASTTSSSITTALSYVGRGVLTKLVLAEITSAGTNVRTFALKVTIDGTVIWNGTTLTRESAWRVVVGNFFETGGTNHGIVDSATGIPFNQSCLIEFTSDGTRTLTVGWHIDYKL